MVLNKNLDTYLKPVPLLVYRFWNRLVNNVGQHGLASVRQGERSRIVWCNNIAAQPLSSHIFENCFMEVKDEYVSYQQKKQNWNILFRSKTSLDLVKATL